MQKSSTAREFVYRFIGALWMGLGIFLLLVSMGFLVARASINEFFLAQFPLVSAFFRPLLNEIVPDLQVVGGIVFAVFCVLFGLYFARLDPKARTIGIAFHILVGACLISLTLLAYMRLKSLTALNFVLPDFSVEVIALMGGFIGAVLVYIGFDLSTIPAQDVFFHSSLPEVERTQALRSLKEEIDAPSRTVTRAELVDLQTNRRHRIRLSGQTRIGREVPDSEVRIDDPTVSRLHALIECVDGQFFLHAYPSTNKTLVEDQEIRDIELKPDVQVHFGRTNFRFQVE